MTYFPFFTDIENKRFLIIGGGDVAKEKVSRLGAFTDNICVIAPETDIEGVRVKRKLFEESDLDEADICVCAAGDRELDRRVAKLCGQRNIPVNVADDADLCTFIFPALVKRGDLVIGITTSGASPAFASLLRKQIEEALPEDIEDVLDLMRGLRDIMPGLISDPKKRSSAYKHILAELLAVEGTISETDAASVIEKYMAGKRIADPDGDRSDG